MDQQTKHPQPADEKQAEFMIGALVGAMAGAAAALLLTPKSGKEMRSIVKEYAKEWEAEAYQLAKEGKGVTKSLRQALDEGANNLAEVAPHKINDAAQQAQHFAVAIEQHIETARDTVSEIAEAFRSGWQEYGEEIVPELQAQSNSNKLDIPDVLVAQPEQAEVEDEQVDDQPPRSVSHGRRRTHTSHYAMHSSTVDEAPVKEELVIVSRPMLASEEVIDQPQSDTSHYTTRVLEEVAPRTAKADPKDDAKDPKAETKDRKDGDKEDKDESSKSAKKTAKDSDKQANASKDDDTDSDKAKSGKKLFFRRGS